ncbi:hypothetical protein PAPHI01_0511 [Pancytospora philotis]|nr:hypothetical protein PAPHI01_0511 [Pancytospora philotis]
MRQAASLDKRAVPACIADAPEEYKGLVESTTLENAEAVLGQLLRANDSSELFRALLYDFVARIAPAEGEIGSASVSLIQRVLSAIKDSRDAAPILFLVFGRLKGRRHEELRIRVLELIQRADFTVASVLEMLYWPDCADTVVDVLGARAALADDFIRQSVGIDNPTVVKNVSQIFPLLPIEHFLNYGAFRFLGESEHYSLRCCFIEIAERLVLHFRGESNLESIRDLTRLVEERLSDVNFYVRGRALGCIASLFAKECVLKDQRNTLIREITQRVKDKTVNVRKKSVSMLGEILLNHPFKHKKTLAPEEPECAENASNTTAGTKRIEQDFREFVELMEEALAAITKLLDYDLKTDIVEIVTFIKIAYVLQLRGSTRAFEMILGLVYSKDRQLVVDMLNEIAAVRRDVVYEFINNRAFDEALRLMSVSEEMLYKNFYGGYRTLESAYVLRQLGRKISESNGLVLLEHATGILFGSRDEAELEQSMAIYNHVLVILQHLRSRTAPGSDLLRLAGKNIAKMRFYDKSVVKNTVQLFYAVSLNPEKSCGKLVKNLVLCKSKLKLLDCVGWIALSQYFLLERLERNYKGQDQKKDGRALQLGADKLVKFRRSIGSEGLTDLREKRKSLEEARRLSLGKAGGAAKMSLKYDELSESMRDKTDEEIADFFFFLRENELLFSPSSLLHQFTPLIEDSLHAAEHEIQTAAYFTLNAWMLTSSAFFSSHLPLFMGSLTHPSAIIKNNAVAALHDFVILYNASIDSSILFSYLTDPDINKNVALAIHSLLSKNVIRIKNNSTKLVVHLFDPAIGSIIRSIVRSLSVGNNNISIIFYETFVSALDTAIVEYLCGLISPSIHESLFLKCLTSGAPLERICRVHGKFAISEKFVEEQRFRPEMQALLEQLGRAEQHKT